MAWGECHAEKHFVAEIVKSFGEHSQWIESLDGLLL